MSVKPAIHWVAVKGVRVCYLVFMRHIIGVEKPKISGEPRCLAANCVPVSEMVQRRHLCSAAGHQLVMPSYRLNSCGLRAFSVLGPRLWNSLPILLHDTSHNTTSFGHSLKTFFLSEY